MKGLYRADEERLVLKPNMILIGLGPYAKNHYFSFFKKHQFYPKIIVDLDSKRNDIENFLQSQQLNIPIFLIPDKDKNCEVLPEDLNAMLSALVYRCEVTHAIIATEPKAHYSYLNFLIENGIHVLVEKPLTAPENTSFSIHAAEKIEIDYYALLKKIEQNPQKKTRVDLHCQRRYHNVYAFVLEQIESFVKEFDVPLTYCDVYHCDGMWNMPNEFLSRENHPYKYGYGKLLHSGYHFIDLLALLLKTSFKHCSKLPDSAEMYGAGFFPLDSLTVIDQKNYSQLFNGQMFNEVFEDPYSLDFPSFGELDFFSILQIFQGDKRITTCNINLLQTGFCRRAWTSLPEDTYKSNGRIRHERINLQFGPLLNIQVHSYLSSESKEKEIFDQFSAGQARHFDVMIFRNSELIGGKPFEQFRFNDFTGNEMSSFNQMSREKSLINFLNDGKSLTGLQEHKLGIQLLSKALKTLCRKNADQIPIEKFDIDILSNQYLCV